MRDLESTNGTFIDERELEAGTETELSLGSEVIFGSAPPRASPSFPKPTPAVMPVPLVTWQAESSRSGETFFKYQQLKFLILSSNHYELRKTSS